MSIPYIGITDFTSFEQVEYMFSVFKQNLPKGIERKLHVGVMMSFKTLHNLDTKWSKAFPQKQRIPSIFGSDVTLNCLHYADYDHREDFWKDLALAIGYCGIGIHAVQLDMVWPEPGEIASAIHTSRKQLEVILQVNSKAMEEVGNSPTEVVKRLTEYEGVVHRVLLDKSMGRGLGMDALGLLPYMRAIKTILPEMAITVAGGLGPTTMELIVPIVAEFPDVSWDAQGRLRQSGNALDPIDWEMAGEYLVRSLRLAEQ